MPLYLALVVAALTPAMDMLVLRVTGPQFEEWNDKMYVALLCCCLSPHCYCVMGKAVGEVHAHLDRDCCAACGAVRTVGVSVRFASAGRCVDSASRADSDLPRDQSCAGYDGRTGPAHRAVKSLAGTIGKRMCNCLSVVDDFVVEIVCFVCCNS